MPALSISKNAFYWLAHVILSVALWQSLAPTASAQLGGRNDFTPSKVIPVEGPAQTEPLITRPWEVTFYTNAINVLNADYANADSQIVGGLFIATTKYNVYDLTRVSTTRSHGGSLIGVEVYTSNQRSFVLETIENVEGELEFVIPVIAYRNGPDFLFDSRFVTDQYRHPGTFFEEIVNMELWGHSREFVIALLEETLRYYTQFGFLEYINQATNPPVLSGITFKSGRYNAGRLFLTMHNTLGRTRVVIKGTVAVTETQSRLEERIPFEEIVDVPASVGGNPVEVELDIGTVYDAAIVMILNGSTFLDRSYFPDGTWGFAGGRAQITEFETFEEIRFDPPGFALARSIFMRGMVTNWASAYRFFRFAGTPVDLSAFDQLEFTALGQGDVRLFLEKQELKGLVQYGYTFQLEPDKRRYIVPFSAFGRAGEIGGFDGSGVTALQFYVLGNNLNETPFDMLIEDVSFINSTEQPVAIAEELETAHVRLLPSYPNPFQTQTTIAFDLPTAASVTLRVFDLLGRNVQTLVEGFQPAGRHAVPFDAHDLPSGTYFYRLEAAGHTQTRMLTLAN